MSKPESKQQKRVLEEDEYIGKISEIIKRDYFPDLDLLNAQYDHELAKESKDPELIYYTLQQILKITNSTDSCKTQKSLDEFLATYTSEDNASFERILFKINRNKRQKHQWLYKQDEKCQLTLLNNGRVLESYVSKNNVSNLNCNPFNSLMFIPDSYKVSKVPSTFYHDRINKQNVTLSQINCIKSNDISQTCKSSAGKSFNYVPNTPVIVPSVSNMPMTWGVIDGTPTKIDDSVHSICSSEHSYNLPPTPKREVIADALLTNSSSKSSTFKSKIHCKNSRQNTVFPIPKTPLQKIFSKTFKTKTF